MMFDVELRRVVDDVLATHAGAADPGAATSDPGTLWSLLAELGWPLVGVAEDAGGSGGDIRAAVELAAGVGRHAAAVPLIESGLAAWALAEAGLPITRPEGRAAVALARPGSARLRPADGPGAGWRLEGSVRDVPWLPEVDTVVLVVEESDATVVAVLDSPGADSPGAGSGAGATPRGEVAARTLAGEPVGTLHLDGVVIPDGAVVRAPAPLAAAIADRGALLRAAAIAGAIERTVDLAREYVGARQQFGRPLSALQAVRHIVAALAVERDLVDAAVSVALDRPGRPTTAAARVSAAGSAGLVATGAHQLHGAMGITQEYPLHRFTRRLWAWRDCGGTQRHWERLLGEEVTAAGSDDRLWALVTGAPVTAAPV